MPFTRNFVPWRFRSGYWYYTNYYSAISTNVADSVSGGGRHYVTPTYFPHPLTITEIGICYSVGQANTGVRLTIHADDRLYPSALILDTGTVATVPTLATTTGGGGAAYSALSPLPIALASGVYWFGVIPSGGTTQPSLAMFQQTNSIPISQWVRPQTGSVGGYYVDLVTPFTPTPVYTTNPTVNAYAPQIFFKVG